MLGHRAAPSPSPKAVTGLLQPGCWPTSTEASVVDLDLCSGYPTSADGFGDGILAPDEFHLVRLSL